MTVTEFKLELLKYNFQIVERYRYDDTFKEEAIQTRLEKFDVDGLLWYVEISFRKEDYCKDVHLQFLQRGLEYIEEAIDIRHTTNPLCCDHSIILIGTRQVCTKCFAKFGDRLTPVLCNN